MYNGKVQLIVTLQWSNDRKTVVIDNKEFDTYDEAYAELEKSKPYFAEAEDGDEREDWEAEVSKGNEPFTMWCGHLNDSCYWLGAIYYAK